MVKQNTIQGEEADVTTSDQKLNPIDTNKIRKFPGNRILFPIGKKTVERWKTVYSVNPTCENLNQ